MEVEEKTIVTGGLKGWQGVGGDFETHFFRLLPSEELRNFGVFFPRNCITPGKKILYEHLHLSTVIANGSQPEFSGPLLLGIQ